jgi:hypothetical protein
VGINNQGKIPKADVGRNGAGVLIAICAKERDENSERSFTGMSAVSNGETG